MKQLLALGFIYFLIFSHAQAQQASWYEFRGVWVASVGNIDFPSRKNLSVNEQKQSFRALLDAQQALGINAVMVQVRPAADALYPSKYEPWSEFLTGKQGQPPVPFYDPLQFMIEETHKRGMEFHAWINPYRAVWQIHTSSVSPRHITKQHPEWFVVYGNTQYFNPGLPEVRAHILKIVADIVTRYNLDAIHMDDYFYPYKIAKKEFPDNEAYRKYGKKMDKNAWRRSNCDSIVKELYTTIKNIKPNVKFGISPFGVWRNKSEDPNGSNTHAGQSNYDVLHANVLLWLQQGWIDYVVPQLYWEHGHRLCDYNVLLDWWNKYTYGRHLYIGISVANAIESKRDAWRNVNELPTQIADARKYATTQGEVYFSCSSFNNNPNGFSDSLKQHYYAHPAIVPPMPWIDNTTPAPPSVTNDNTDNYVVKNNTGQCIKGFAVFSLPVGETNDTKATLLKIIVSNTQIIVNKKQLQDNDTVDYLVAIIGANNNLSDRVKLIRRL